MSQPTTCIELLEALKRHFADDDGVPASDYRIAKILGMTKGAVSTWRSGRARIGDDTALKVAEILGLDVQFVLASLAAERAARAQNVRVADAWRTIAKRVAAVTIVGTTLLLPFPERVSAAVPVSGGSVNSMHYARRRRTRHPARSGPDPRRPSPFRLRPSPGRAANPRAA